jgi:hypothetical protein
MKKSCEIFGSLILLTIISCKKNISSHLQKDCEVMKQTGIIDSFSYPVRPGTVEWKKLKNNQEMLYAVNIPEYILHNMCTLGLVYTCVQCPLYWDILAWEDKDTGFKFMVDNINSFSELIQRDNAGKELFDYYRTLTPSDYDTTWNPIKQGDFMLQIYITEIYLSRQAFLGLLTDDELECVVKESYVKFQEKEENGLSERCKLGSFYLIGNILYYNINFKPFISFVENNSYIEYFLSDFRPVINNHLDSLKYYTELFLKTIN